MCAVRVCAWLSQLGGNAALINFFKEHGVNDLSIKEKYNTPAAELYRERCVFAAVCGCSL